MSTSKIESLFTFGTRLEQRAFLHMLSKENPFVSSLFLILVYQSGWLAKEDVITCTSFYLFFPAKFHVSAIIADLLNETGYVKNANIAFFIQA